MLPLLDPRRLTSAQADDLVGLFEVVARRPVEGVDVDLRDPDRQALDRWAMRYLVGDADASDAARTVERALRDLAAERTDRLASGREQQRVAVRRQGFDSGPVATRLLLENGNPPSVLARLARYEPDALGTVTVVVPDHGPIVHLAAGQSLFDSDRVLVNENLVIDTPSGAHAELVMAALRVDSSLAGPIAMPEAEDEAEAIRQAAQQDWDTWRHAVTAAVAAVLPGAQRASRRHDVGRELERQVGAVPGTVVAF